ncbi:helix-turn-helix transcriptional regulator [Trinickia sp. NRRL B-1857]|uniref:response regulator transcription factor n=1 Tax=Trinickia sp. NRRL B-1857 TaxID=3162879 RepID=UPI003D2995C7
MSELNKKKPSTAPFSKREQQVLGLLGDGKSDKQIARRLGISDLTARKHRANLLKKAHASNVCELLFVSLASGWLDVPEELP